MEKKVKRSQFSQYSPLMTQLSRKKIKFPGKVATFLLELFTDIDSREWLPLKKEMLVEKGILKDTDNFNAWRDELTQKDFLEWRLKGKNPGKAIYHLASHYRPGKSFLPYLNKEMMKQGQVALKTDVEIIKAELHQEKIARKIDNENLEAKLEEFKTNVEEQFSEIRNLLDPPITEEKIEKARKLSVVKV